MAAETPARVGDPVELVAECVSSLGQLDRLGVEVVELLQLADGERGELRLELLERVA